MTSLFNKFYKYFLQERASGIEGVSSQNMIDILPCSDKTKLDAFKSTVKLHQSKLFIDDMVHMLMVMLVLFDSQDVDENVRKVHYTSLNMLRGYLEAHTKNPEMEFLSILNCVKDVPRITLMRIQMIADFKVPVTVQTNK